MTAFDDGSCIVIGYMEGDATFGVGESNEATLTSGSDETVFAAKYSSVGELIWARIIAEGNFPNEECTTGLAIDGADDGSFSAAIAFGGDLTVDGQFSFQEGGNNGRLIARFDSSGDVVWTDHIAGNWWYARRNLDVLPDGTTLVTGVFTEESENSSEIESEITFGLGLDSETSLTEPDGGLYIVRYSPERRCRMGNEREIGHLRRQPSVRRVKQHP